MQMTHDSNYKPFLNKRFICLLSFVLTTWFSLMFYAIHLDNSAISKINKENRKLLEWWINSYFESYWYYPASLIDLESGNIMRPIDLVTKIDGRVRFAYKKTKTWFILDNLE